MTQLKPSKIVGRILVPKGSSTNVRLKPTTNSRVISNFKKGEQIGTVLGYVGSKTKANQRWYRVKFLKPQGFNFKGWVRADVIQVKSKTPDFVELTKIQKQRSIDRLNDLQKKRCINLEKDGINF